MAELIIQSGKLKGKRLALPAKEMVVGRDDDCDLRIASSLVSRKHCILKNMPEGILVTDLSSQNGTHVNDVPISEPTLLREGDMLRIGATLLEVPSVSKPKSTPGSSNPLISEADIADWLMESGSSSSGADTAVIGSSYVPKELTATPPPATINPTPKPKTSSSPKPQLAKVLSVKDEAAIIIQKHWETVKAKQKQT
jgi:pSer/pThr/pTyr-binding forkhead associated (FHA) protein